MAGKPSAEFGVALASSKTPTLTNVTRPAALEMSLPLESLR